MSAFDGQHYFIRGGAPNPPFFFSSQKTKAKRLAPREAIKFIFIRAFYNLSFLGRRPKPALLFLIAEKEGKKASPLGTYKTYFEPGVLQLPTVKQIKRLYNSVQNRFYKQVQKGAFNGNGKNKSEQKRQKLGGKRHFVLCRSC